jgi:hypothetical protein
MKFTRINHKTILFNTQYGFLYERHPTWRIINNVQVVFTSGLLTFRVGYITELHYNFMTQEIKYYYK